MTNPLILTALLVLAPVGAAPAAAAAPVAVWQESEDPDLARLESFLDKARTGSAVIRPQAAARLVRLGKPAAERLLALTEAGPPAMAELGQELVEVLAAFEEPRLRERLWAALDDRDFPWRPAAARSLAKHPVQEGAARELSAFRGLLADPVAPVRMAAVQGVAALAAKPTDTLRAEVRARLADPSDFVRRTAAVTLVRWGEPTALHWLLEELQRTDVFFERWTGKAAAYEARRALQELLGDAYGYDPELAPSHPTNDIALEKLREAVRSRTGDAATPELPEIARNGTTPPDAVLGLELVSCRRGEHYLAWTAGDELLVGLGRPARVQLPKGTTARLAALARGEVATLQRPFFGTPGCDIEMLRLADSPGGSARTWVVSKGQASVADLRPEALGRVMRALIESIPSDLDASDPRLADLRAAARETMESVGGP